jgi:hypothetical protein
MTTRLGDMAVGSTVKIKVNGTLTDFLIVHQGKPSSVYDDSCNGTWLLMKDIYEKRQWDSSNTNDYAGSTIHSYLNSTLLNLFESNIKNAIKRVKIPYRKDSGASTTVTSGSNGLSAKIFLLSATETSFSFGTMPSGEGAELAYFKGCADNGQDSKRVAYLNGSVTNWWLRSPYCGNDSHGALYVNPGGMWSASDCSYSFGIRPALILPSTLLVSDDGTVSANTAPAINASSTNLGEKNEPFALSYTVTDGDGDPMTITEKVNGMEMAVRENVASGAELTVQCLSEKALFQQILNGENTLTLEANDGKTTAEWTTTFTKNVTRVALSLAQPLTADDTITVASMTLEGSFPADMSLTVELTNNALDDVPVWENCTDIQSGKAKAFVHHNFTNKTAAKEAAFNYKVTITRGGSGVGGNITMIGGVIG